MYTAHCVSGTPSPTQGPVLVRQGVEPPKKLEKVMICDARWGSTFKTPQSKLWKKVKSVHTDWSFKDLTPWGSPGLP